MLLLTRFVVAALATAHDGALPREVCGLVLGANGGAWSLGSGIVVARGAGEPDGFEVPDHEMKRMAGYAAERGVVIVALFHSHPSGVLILGERDNRGLRHSAWPWLLVARHPSDGELRLAAYAPGEGRALELRKVGNHYRRGLRNRR